MAKINLQDKTAWFVGGTHDHTSRNAAQDLKECGGFGHANPFRHVNIALDAMNDQLSIRPDVIVMVDEQPDAGRQYTDKIIAAAKEKKIPVLLFTERETSEQLELAKNGVKVFPA
jgi:AmiR/NasT family two-component response regulator